MSNVFNYINSKTDGDNREWAENKIKQYFNTTQFKNFNVLINNVEISGEDLLHIILNPSNYSIKSLDAGPFFLDKIKEKEFLESDEIFWYLASCILCYYDSSEYLKNRN